mmetsp:Transcript_123958/g.214920  ORF Transcript_123958/g.214920 Transcript_123958/m.214920 type:complete len:93 (+) Transcript_123958:1393-1671(+)
MEVLATGSPFHAGQTFSNGSMCSCYLVQHSPTVPPEHLSVSTRTKTVSKLGQKSVFEHSKLLESFFDPFWTYSGAQRIEGDRMQGDRKRQSA